MLAVFICSKTVYFVTFSKPEPPQLGQDRLPAAGARGVCGQVNGSIKLHSIKFMYLCVCCLYMSQTCIFSTCSKIVKNSTFAVTPSVLTPLVRNQASPTGMLLDTPPAQRGRERGRGRKPRQWYLRAPDNVSIG